EWNVMGLMAVLFVPLKLAVSASWPLKSTPAGSIVSMRKSLWIATVVWMVPSANSVMWNVAWPLEELIAGAPVHGFVSGWTEVLFLVTVVSLTTGGPAADAVLATASVASVTPTSKIGRAHV